MNDGYTSASSTNTPVGSDPAERDNVMEYTRYNIYSTLTPSMPLRSYDTTTTAF